MNIAVILAGGSGTRMQLDCPKQFLLLDEKPLFLHSLTSFATHPEIDRVILVCDSEHIEHAKTLLKAELLSEQKPNPCAVDITVGGATRQESVYNGLLKSKALSRALSKGCDDIVLIHDSARPFVSTKIISQCIKSVKANGACTVAIPSQDTILISHDGKLISDIPKREEMYCTQTPQGFKLDEILLAHEQALSNNITTTDDAAIFMALGKSVSIVIGDKRNFKITTKEDLTLAKSLI